MICASRRANDACQGDSGGPLNFKWNDISSDVQIGIVSYEVGCADIEFSGVYVLVATADDFIQDLLTCEVPDETDISTLQSSCTILCEYSNYNTINFDEHEAWLWVCFRYSGYFDKINYGITHFS